MACADGDGLEVVNHVPMIEALVVVKTVARRPGGGRIIAALVADPVLLLSASYASTGHTSTHTFAPPSDIGNS